jgi:hypothetical protein
MDIQGKWKVRYSAKQDAIFVNEDGEPDEIGLVELIDGSVSGSDQWGGHYSGTYQLDGSKLTALVSVRSDEMDQPFIIDGVSNPFELLLEGEFNSPDYFSMRGFVKDKPGSEIILNCSRVKCDG